MATSLINIECKRYGCMKNLLACYANCRFNTRCDELRADVLVNKEQATADINAYRATRGAAPIEIQPLKRGLKFVDLTVAKKLSPTNRKQRLNQVKSKRRDVKNLSQPAPAPQPVIGKAKAQTSAVESPPSKPGTKTLTEKKPARKSSKRRIKKPEAKRMMARKAIGKTRAAQPAIERFSAPSGNNREAGKETDKAASEATIRKSEPRRKRSARKPSAAQKKVKKTFIILHGDRATIVDEQGLISQLLTGGTNGARFFEAKEVEAKLEISYKR